MSYKTFVLLAISLVLFSCEFQKTINLEIPTPDDQLAIIAYLAPNGHSLISLTQSVGIFDDSIPTPPTHPTCQIYEDGTLLQELTTLREDGTFEISSNLPIKTGHTYHLTASADGLLDIQSQNIEIPVTIPLESASIIDTLDRNLTVSITFNDPVDQKNYYLLKIDKYIQGQLLPNSTSTEPFIDPAAVFSDISFDGKLHQETRKINSYGEYMNEYLPVEKIQLILFSLSPSTYKYFNSLNEYESTASDPTLESFPVYSNIENGYGILGGLSTDTITIQ